VGRSPANIFLMIFGQFLKFFFGLARLNSWKYGISKNKSVRDLGSEGAVPVSWRDED